MGSTWSHLDQPPDHQVPLAVRRNSTHQVPHQGCWLATRCWSEIQPTMTSPLRARITYRERNAGTTGPRPGGNRPRWPQAPLSQALCARFKLCVHPRALLLRSLKSASTASRALSRQWAFGSNGVSEGRDQNVAGVSACVVEARRTSSHRNSSGTSGQNSPSFSRCSSSSLETWPSEEIALMCSREG